jgi:hypothetical protein
MHITLRCSLIYTLPLALLSASIATPLRVLAFEQPESQDAPQYPSQDSGQPQDNAQPQDNPQPPPDYSQNQGYSNDRAFTPDQLDNLLSPIALYPDPLLAQVLVAATFPDQIQDAANYVRANGTTSIDEQNWDVSVRAVAHYAAVLDMMADKIDWTTSLGQAYVNQSSDVSSAVQRLRHEARRAGNLASTPQQEVIAHDDYIAINPYQPQYLYVPVYDPAIIYFRRPYWGPAISFGVGFPIGGWLNLGFHWGWGGGFGGIFYTGWNPWGWGRGCWNCGWIGRSRGFVDFHNNMYVNNRYSHININRTVVNRTVNVNNLNRFNSVHQNVRYNNVAANNARVDRAGFNGSNTDVRAGFNSGARANVNSNGRTNAFAGSNRALASTNNYRATPTNNNDRAGQNNATRNDRPANTRLQSRAAQQPRPQTQQSRPAMQSRPADQSRPPTQSRPAAQSRPPVRSRPAQQYSGTRTAARSAGNFNSRQSNSPRPQASRQPQHSAPQHQASRAPAPHNSSRGGEGGKRNR